MPTINPDDVSVLEMYVDSISDERTTEVYNNGKMQACVFPVVTYKLNGSDPIDDIVEELKKYAYDKVQIYRHTQSGGKVPVEWEFCSESNGYRHDINRGPSRKGVQLSKDPKINIRVPFYFTVPVGAAGDYRWIAKHNGKFMDDKAFVTIKCHTFSIHISNFDFIEVTVKNNYHLRALSYVNLLQQNTVQLLRCLEYQGNKVDAGGSVGECWRAYYGSYHEAFYLLEKHSSTNSTVSVAASADTEAQDWGENFTSAEVQMAWSRGIAVVAHYFSSSIHFKVDKLQVEDNCGNKMEIDIDKWSIERVVIKL